MAELREQSEAKVKELRENCERGVLRLRDRLEEEARVEAEINLMKIVLPALQEHLHAFMSERETQLSKSMELKDREINSLQK